MPRIPGFLTTWWGKALAALVLAAALAPLLRPILVTRHVELTLDLRNAHPAWELEWIPAQSHRARNGFWIDPRVYGVPEVNGRFTTAASLYVRRELPSYPLRTLSVKWNDNDGGEFAVRRLAIVTKLAGRAWRTDVLIDEPAATMQPTQPASSRLDADVPALAAVTWLFVLGVSWLALSAAYLGLRFALRIPPLWDRLVERVAGRPSARAPRWLKVFAWAAAIGAPLWLASWAPMLLLSDSTAYIWLGKLLWENRDINHLDGWRLPGYALFIAPWVVYTDQYTLWIGLSQAALGIGSAVLAFDILRRRGLGGVWPCIGMLLVALDPMMMVWQRTVLSESPGAFLILLVAWVFTVLEPRLRTGSATRMLLAFAGLGALCGIAATVRGNLQLLLLVIAAGVIAIGFLSRKPARALLAAGVMLATFALTISPILRHNYRVFGRASLVVGANTGRTIFAWQNTDIDFNQTRLFTLEQFRDLNDRVGRGEMSDWEFTAEIERNDRVEVRTGTHPWVTRDLRCTEVLRESMSRMPSRYAKRLVKATASQLGFWVDYPKHFKRNSAGQVSVMRGRPVAEPTNFYDRISRFPATIRPTLERVIHDASGVHTTLNSRAMGVWWNVWREARPVLVLLLAFGALRALARRDVPTLVLALFVFGNTAAVVVMQFAGIDRYGMPFFGVGNVAMLLGLLAGTPAADASAAQRKPT
ncbi:hypothetical protein PHYC_00329 [Phycisphaerales bacterium]|nr:hypothetical protein PHYC_00329 [Phycisphaerales bacterium]